MVTVGCGVFRMILFLLVSLTLISHQVFSCWYTNDDRQFSGELNIYGGWQFLKENSTEGRSFAIPQEYYGLTVEECAYACVEYSQNNCTHFNFDGKKNLCQLIYFDSSAFSTIASNIYDLYWRCTFADLPLVNFSISSGYGLGGESYATPFLSTTITGCIVGCRENSDDLGEYFLRAVKWSDNNVCECISEIKRKLLVEMQMFAIRPGICSIPCLNGHFNKHNCFCDCFVGWYGKSCNLSDSTNCIGPLGIENITAQNGENANSARFNRNELDLYVWAPAIVVSSASFWIDITLSGIAEIYALAIYGGRSSKVAADDQWIIRYLLGYFQENSLDITDYEINGFFIFFPGNFQPNHVRYQLLANTILSHKIRFTAANWQGDVPGLKIELYGCSSSEDVSTNLPQESLNDVTNSTSTAININNSVTTVYESIPTTNATATGVIYSTVTLNTYTENESIVNFTSTEHATTSTEHATPSTEHATTSFFEHSTEHATTSSEHETMSTEHSETPTEQGATSTAEPRVWQTVVLDANIPTTEHEITTGINELTITTTINHLTSENQISTATTTSNSRELSTTANKNGTSGSFLVGEGGQKNSVNKVTEQRTTNEQDVDYATEQVVLQYTTAGQVEQSIKYLIISKANQLDSCKTEVCINDSVSSVHQAMGLSSAMDAELMHLYFNYIDNLLNTNLSNAAILSDVLIEVDHLLKSSNEKVKTTIQENNVTSGLLLTVENVVNAYFQLNPGKTTINNIKAFNAQLVDLSSIQEGGIIHFTNHNESVVGQLFTPRSTLDKYGLIVVIVYENLHLSRPNDEFVGTHITSITFNQPAENVTTSMELSDELFLQMKLTLDNGYNTQPSCCFWDLHQSQWSDYGCQMTSYNESWVTCFCNHTTSFAVLMQVSDVYISEEHRQALHILTLIGVSISIICLFLTMVAYIFLNLLGMKNIAIHANLTLSLLFAHVIFITGINATDNETLCKVIAILLHYFFLSSFAWMMIEGAYLYVKASQAHRKPLTILHYAIIGWISPLIIVGITVISRFSGYGTPEACWLGQDNGIIWAFVGPVLIVATINTLIMMSVIKTFNSLKTNADKARIQRMKANLRAILVLQPLLGATWLFGVLSFNFTDEWALSFMYLFVICNSLQGAFIFLLHCFMNEEVRKALNHRLNRFQTRRGHKVHSQESSTGQTATTNFT